MDSILASHPADPGLALGSILGVPIFFKFHVAEIYQQSIAYNVDSA